MKQHPSLHDSLNCSAPSLILNEEQRLIADQFISIFENGSTRINYHYAKNIDDNRGITAGRAGFTSATGDMYIVISRYTEIQPDNTLAPYLEELRTLHIAYKDNHYKTNEKCASTENLEGLIEAWKENAEFAAFKAIQDEMVDHFYFSTAVEKANEAGLTLPLSLLALYDANIQHGESGLDDLIMTATEMTDGQTPKDGADELSWLLNFNNNRMNILEGSEEEAWRESTPRVTELIDLIHAGNTHLEPFEMIIEAYDNESHLLPQYK